MGARWAVVLASAGCVGSGGATGVEAAAPDVAAIDDALHARSLGFTDGHRGTFFDILEGALLADPYVCFPHPDVVLAPPRGDRGLGARVVQGEIPHYRVFRGPFRYAIARRADGWKVELHILVHSELGGELELAECRPPASSPGGRCEGVEYPRAPGTEVCPRAGRFSAPRTRANVEILLARWSREVEAFYNRDAERFAIPVHYDFEFVLAGSTPVPARIDAVLRLDPTCGRTPYFASLRSGWSTPIVAHEMGHWLGLTDEYEALSGIVGAYPKTPFPGAERSRMGLSMKPHTVLLPLHHYLVLRRFFCGAPAGGDFGDVLSPP